MLCKATINSDGQEETVMFDPSEYEFLLRKALAPKALSKNNDSCGLLMARPFYASLSAGVGTNDTEWEVEVLGTHQPLSGFSSQSFSYNGDEFEMMRASRNINFFDLIHHRRFCGERTHSRIDLCLPRSFCHAFMEIMEHPAKSPIRSVLVETFVQRVLVQLLLVVDQPEQLDPELYVDQTWMHGETLLRGAH